MVDLSIQSFLPQAVQYLQDAQPTSIPNWRVDRPFEGTPLAQGEYNLNFLVGQGNFHWVLRVNSRSEIGLSNPGQITYEYQTLALLAPSGSPPSPLPRCQPDPPAHGVLGMAYCPGEFLDYKRGLSAAAQLMTRYHQLQVPPEKNHLIREEHPLTQTLTHCQKMLSVYRESDLANPEVQAYAARQPAWIEHFYPVSAEIFRGLGELYTSHPEFPANYEQVAPGLADFLQKAMNIYANTVLESK